MLYEVITKQLQALSLWFQGKKVMEVAKITFKEQVLEGIPDVLPSPKAYDVNINHAPKRKDILSSDEKKLARITSYNVCYTKLLRLDCILHA